MLERIHGRSESKKYQITSWKINYSGDALEWMEIKFIYKSCDVNNIMTITWNREINHSIASIGGIINRSEYKRESIRKSISRCPGKNKQRAFAVREAQCTKFY